jgi:hypothetical protein
MTPGEDDDWPGDVNERARVQVVEWEAGYRQAAEADGGARFAADIERFGIEADPSGMVEATIALVKGCCAMRLVDGRPLAEFLEQQTYGEAASPQAVYRLLFDMAPGAVGVVLADARLRAIDLADLYEMPWHAWERVGYQGFWLTRLDGEDLTPEEVDALDAAITADLRFDFDEDEVLFSVDPDTWPGCLYCVVYDHVPELSE